MNALRREIFELAVFDFSRFWDEAIPRSRQKKMHAISETWN
jgi:hypothetical protein